MPSYFVTFGQQYKREPHPTFGKAHPDGWLTVVAPDELTARDTVIGWLGTAWSFIYDEQPDLGWFPRGELHRIEAGPTPTSRPTSACPREDRSRFVKRPEVSPGSSRRTTGARASRCPR